jgi:hypothetical protein
MSGRHGRPRSSRGPLVLVYGEDINDTQSIQHLLRWVDTRFARVVKARRDPQSLQRTAKDRAVDAWVDDLVRAVNAFRSQGYEIKAVFVHRDADLLDNADIERGRLRDQLSPLDEAVPVVPVECTEAWWFLFPSAVESVKPTAWRDVMPRSERNVDTISRPKQQLKMITRRRSHEYAESDSIAIAQFIADQRLSTAGSSPSLQHLITDAQRISSTL